MITNQKYNHYIGVLKFKQFDADREYICHNCGNIISIGIPMVQRLLSPNTEPMLFMHDTISLIINDEIRECIKIREAIWEAADSGSI